ncbi:hypothetical protein F503_00553 [Ophiostoma piceae UAMH 11346]|uniref:Uncharacterized protein n=1 Tax=Ophiostoma piceae (strain UAMH 11346) TaxID=1262450 RepID=S3C7C5_OPHP1|nr:hypothetical protein F503_00553 [Ophiostoma piceae UAMH 11346]
MNSASYSPNMAVCQARFNASASSFLHWATLSLIIAVPLAAASGDTMDMVHPKMLPAMYSIALAQFVVKHRGIYKWWMIGLVATMTVLVAILPTVSWLLYAISDLVALAPFVPHVPPYPAPNNNEAVRERVVDAEKPWPHPSDSSRAPQLNWQHQPCTSSAPVDNNTAGARSTEHASETTKRPEPWPPGEPSVWPDLSGTSQASQLDQQHQPSTLMAPGDNTTAEDCSIKISKLTTTPKPWPPCEPSVRSDLSDGSRASQLDHQQLSQILTHMGPGSETSSLTSSDWLLTGSDSQHSPSYDSNMPRAFFEMESGSDT